jgi:hypothetical protein
MGGSSHVENDAIVQEQIKQAKDADIKEKKRVARIELGKQRIKNAFEGKPVTAPTSHKFDWKTFRPEATTDKTGKVTAAGTLPKGYKYVRVDPRTGKLVAGTPAQAATDPGFTDDPQGFRPPGYTYGPPGTISLTPGHAATAATPATTGEWAIQGADGKIYRKGQNLAYSTNDPTGAVTGGFGQDFYDKYMNAYKDYYDADVNKQYGVAKGEAAYRLARAGLGVSSASNDLTANLESQNTANLDAIANQATAAGATLKDKVAAEKKAATDQLYQTEDPTLAANTALASVRNLSVEQPSLSPLAEVFNIAAVGGANLLKNYNTQATYNRFNAGLPQGAGSSHIEGS